MSDEPNSTDISDSKRHAAAGSTSEKESQKPDKSAEVEMSLEEALEREMDLMNDNGTAVEPSVPKLGTSSSTNVSQPLDVTSQLEQRHLDIQMMTDAPPTTANVPGDKTTPTDAKPPTDVVSQAEQPESGLHVTDAPTIPANVPMEAPAQFVDTSDSAAKESELYPKPSPTDPPSTSEVKDFSAPNSSCQPSISLKFTDAELFELRRSTIEGSSDPYMFGLCDFLKQHEQFPAFMEHMKSELGEEDFSENWSFGDNKGDPLEDAHDFLQWFRKQCGVAEPESTVDSSSHCHSDFEAGSDDGSPTNTSRFKYKSPPSKDHPDINNLLDSAAKAGHDKFS